MLQGHVDACMELNFTTGVCNIYFGWRPDKATRNHERSHCNGWAIPITGSVRPISGILCPRLSRRRNLLKGPHISPPHRGAPMAARF